MERGTPTQKAEAYLKSAEEILEVVKFVENPESKFLYPKAFAKLHSDYDKWMDTTSVLGRPLPIEYYKTELKIGETFLKILSALPEKVWKPTELIKIASFMDFDETDSRRAIWNLVYVGVFDFTSDRSIKVKDELK